MTGQSSFAVCFVQTQARRELPHFNMPLFVRDLERLGCTVHCLCLHAAHLLEEFLASHRVDLLGLEATTPHGLVKRVRRASPATRILVGGNSFLELFAKTEADYAIAGAGREAVKELVRALMGAGELSRVPNLFLRHDDRVTLDFTGIVREPSPAEELIPYEPELNWTYLGFPEPKGTSQQPAAPPTVIADFGCPCRTRRATPEEVSLLTPRVGLTDRARRRLAELQAERRTGGCTFCTYGRFRGAPQETAVGLVVEQMCYLQSTYGFRRFAVGSEAPFRFLEPLLGAAKNAGIVIDQLFLRTRVDWLLRDEAALRGAIARAKTSRLQLVVWQVGFESFCQSSLDQFGKNHPLEMNLRAIALLDELERAHPGTFATPVRSHGFLGSAPRTSLKELDAELELVGRLPARWRCAALGGPVKLYDEMLPFCLDLRGRGLVEPRTGALHSYRYADDRVALLEEARRDAASIVGTGADAMLWGLALDRAIGGLRRLAASLLRRKKSLSEEARKRLRAESKQRLCRDLRELARGRTQYRRGRRLEAKKSLQPAAKAYEAALRHLGPNGPVLAALARVEFALGDRGRAERLARKAIPLLESHCDLVPDDPAVELELAKCHAMLGDSERAGERVERAMAKGRIRNWSTDSFGGPSKAKGLEP